MLIKRLLPIVTNNFLNSHIIQKAYEIHKILYDKKDSLYIYLNCLSSALYVIFFPSPKLLTMR